MPPAEKPTPPPPTPPPEMSTNTKVGAVVVAALVAAGVITAGVLSREDPPAPPGPAASSRHCPEGWFKCQPWTPETPYCYPFPEDCL